MMFTQFHGKRTRGFTLVELIVVIVILGILAAFAVPRFISADSQARVAALRSLAGAMDSAAYLTQSLCMTTAATSGCNNQSSTWTGTINGTFYWLNYGWPDAGDALNDGQIDTIINYAGFTPVLINASETEFQRTDAPNPATCSVDYFDSFDPGPKYHWVMNTSGC